MDIWRYRRTEGRIYDRPILYLKVGILQHKSFGHVASLECCVSRVQKRPDILCLRSRRRVRRRRRSEHWAQVTRPINLEGTGDLRAA